MFSCGQRLARVSLSTRWSEFLCKASFRKLLYDPFPSNTLDRGILNYIRVDKYCPHFRVALPHRRSQFSVFSLFLTKRAANTCTSSCSTPGLLTFPKLQFACPVGGVLRLNIVFLLPTFAGTFDVSAEIDDW